MIEILAASVTTAAIGTSALLLVQRNGWRKRAKQLLAQKQEAEEEVQRVRRQAKIDTQNGIESFIRQARAKFDKDNSHLIAQALVGETFKDLNAKVREVVEGKFHRTTQEFLGGVCDEAEGLSRDLNIELCEKIWDAFQGFKEISKDSPVIFPEGTKLAYTKGNRTVIVIEQKPQVRTVTFHSELVGSTSVAKEAQSRSSNGYRYSLAFPYVYFILVFDGGKYMYHELYFRNKPLTSVREHIHLAPIPNVWRNKERRADNAMCMGDGFYAAVGGEATIARQCDLVVADFWQRTFSKDLGTGDPGAVDKRIKNYAVWQENSEKDPLFVLTVNWPKGKTIKGVIEFNLDNREQKHKLDAVDKKIRKLLEDGVAKLTERLKQEIAEAKTKGFTQFDLDMKAKELLEQVVLEHAQRVFVRCAA